MADFNRLQQRFMLDLYPNRGLTLVRGEGVHLYSDKGDGYLDMMTNYGVNIFGYHHPAITQALISQLRFLTTLHCSFSNDARARASQALLKSLGPGYQAVYWSNSGAEAVEAALKFAVLTTGRKKFIACTGAYHGKTLGALSATDGQKYREPFLPLLWDFTRVDYGDPGALEDGTGPDTAAFIVEPVQGESGIILPPPAYLRKAREICSREGVLLILDEVQSGCGRTGKFLACEHEEVVADMVCLGKGLAGGMPVGATAVGPRVAESMKKSIHSSTFGGNPLSAAGVLAVLRELTGERLEAVGAMGAFFLGLLRELKSANIREVRGLGLMAGVEVLDKRNEILQELQKRKILAAPAGDRVVRFLPPFIIEKQHAEETVEALAETLYVV